MTKECIFYTKENPFWSSKAGAQLLLVNDRSGTLQNYDFSMNSGIADSILVGEYILTMSSLTGFSLVQKIHALIISRCN